MRECRLVVPDMERLWSRPLDPEVYQTPSALQFPCACTDVIGRGSSDTSPSAPKTWGKSHPDSDDT